MLSNIKYYIKNFSWLMLENILKILFGFFVFIYVIKYLGPIQFGMLSFVLSIAGIIAPFATLGTESILFRELIKYKKNEKVLMHTARIIRIIISLIWCMTAFAIFYFYSNDSLSIELFSILLVSIVLQSFMIYREYFTAFEKVKYITLSSIISLTFTNLYRLALIFLKAKLVWFAVAYVIEKLTNIISLKYFYKKISKKGQLLVNKTIAKQIIKDSWPLMFTTFARTLYLQVDQILIKYYLGYEAVGLYATAVKLIMLFYVIPTIISNIIYPRVLQWYKNNSKTEFIHKMEFIYFINLLIALFIYLLVYIFGEWFIINFFSEKFYNSIDVLMIYSLALILVFFNANNNKLLMMENLQKLMLKRTIIGLLINISLNIIFISRYGIIGAAYATVISEIFVLLSYSADGRTRYIFFIQIKACLYPYSFLKEKFR
jgi:O-antigen/teichoic acid export membrane protein